MGASRIFILNNWEDVEKIHQNEKLLIKGVSESLNGVANAIIAMSPEETQFFDIDNFSRSFSLFSFFLDCYVGAITAIMSTLAILFLFLYTITKCRE